MPIINLFFRRKNILMRKFPFLALVPMAVLLTIGCASEQPANTPVQPAAENGPGENIPPEDFTYTEKPTVAMVPGCSSGGMANGKLFPVKTVLFQPGYEGNWDLYLLDTKMADPLAVLLEGQYIAIRLTEPPAVGKTMSRPLDFGGGIFQIKENNNPEETTCWNSPNAWELEITQWDVKPWNPDGEIFQEAGTAAGKIAICYQGSCGFADSWAAVTFQDAIVRYMGPPEEAK